MQGSAAVAVEVLNIAGIAAVRHGNLIEVATGLVGVEEACSGMRGLQTSLMVSLVLGELGRLSISRRFVLVLAGAVVAILFNLLRAVVLSGLAATQGLGAVDHWHDAAGFAEFGGILAGVLLAYWVVETENGSRFCAAARCGRRGCRLVCVRFPPAFPSLGCSF